MIKTAEQFAAANKAAVDSLLTIANTSLAHAERLAALNLNTARDFVANATANISVLMTAKDAQELLALRGTLAKPAVERTVAYSQSVYQILNDSHKELSQIVEGHAAEFKQNISAAIEQSLSQAPAGSETIVAAVKSALAHADSAFETVTRSSKEAKALIENTVASANAAAINLMSKAA